jgi:hypothetical protein
MQPDGTTLSVPFQSGTIEYANGDVELHICNVLTVSVPYGKSSLEDCEWLDYQYMESKYRLLSLYRDALDADRENDQGDTSGTTEFSQMAQNARSAVEGPTKVPKGRRNNHWLHRRVWLRPEIFEGLKERPLRQLFRQKFARGLRVTYVKDRIVALDEERLTDVWAISKTGRGEFILDYPLCNDSVPIQKAINKFNNLALETVLRGVPKTLVNSALIDVEAWKKNATLPIELMPVKPKDGEPLDRSVVTLQAAKFSEQLMPFNASMRETMQDISGIRPEIAGGGAPTSTFREARQRRDQALMQLAPPADEMRAAYEQAYTNGIRLRARYGNGRVAAPTVSFGDTSDAFDMSELPATGWHVEADEAMPMSFIDRSDRLNTYLKEFPPNVQDYLGLLDPINANNALSLLQLPDFKTPMFDEREKVIGVIQKLLQEAPVQQPDPMTGQPTDMPTVMPEEHVDNYQFCADLVRKWCNSAAGRAASEKNPQGYANVKAYLIQQDNKAAAAMAAQPPPPPDGGGNGGAPPPKAAGSPAGPPQPGAPNDPQTPQIPSVFAPDSQEVPLPPLPPEGNPGAMAATVQ